MPESIRELYERARSLMKVGDLAGVEEIISIISKRGDLTQEENLPWIILNGRMLFDLGQFPESVILGKKAFKIAEKLDKKPEMFDAQLLMRNYDKAEEIFKTLGTMLDHHDREFLLSNGKALQNSMINKAEKALEWLNRAISLAENSDDKRSLYWCYDIGSMVYLIKSEFDKCLEYAKKSFNISRELSHKVYMAHGYNTVGTTQIYNGNLTKALENVNKSMQIDGVNKFTMVYNFRNLGWIYDITGELDKALESVERGIKLAEELGAFGGMGDLLGLKGKIIWKSGDYTRAADFLEKSIKMCESAGYFYNGTLMKLNLLMVYVDDGKTGEAQVILNQFKGIADITGEELWERALDFCKAYILKEGGRSKDRVEAERLFKKVLESNMAPKEFIIIILINLGDLLFTELKITNNEEVLDEISPIIDKLKKFAEKQNLFSAMAETYLLQAKISLVKLNMGDARRYITKAQQISEKYGLDLLARKISSVHDSILEQLNVWEDFKKNESPVSERLKLVDLNVSVNRIMGKNPLEAPDLSTEQPVCIAIFSKTGYPVFSYKFSEDIEFDDKKIGSIISLSGEMYSHSLDRLKFGEFTILLNEIGSNSLCYVFVGQSYGAGQKLNNFTEAIKENKGIIELLNTAIRTGHQIILSDNPDLEELITSCFMSDPEKFKLPFKAYKGDDPFLFVSYAHSDKLQVYPIMDYLNKSGFNVWYDEGISVSEDWKESIVANIEKCSAFLVFITPHIIDSKYVRKEISFALDIDKSFYAVYLKDTTLPSSLKFEISGIQSMKKYTMPDSEFYEKIKEVLSPVLSGKN